MFSRFSMLRNSEHLSRAPVFDPYFLNLLSFISKCRSILFNRVGQRDLHGLFWRAHGLIAGVREQGLEWDVCLLACKVLDHPPLFYLCHGVGRWCWEPSFLPSAAEKLPLSCTSLGLKTRMVWLYFSWSSLLAFPGAGISLVGNLVRFRVTRTSAGRLV